jgi:hypothetical protein
VNRQIINIEWDNQIVHLVKPGCTKRLVLAGTLTESKLSTLDCLTNVDCFESKQEN